MYQEFLLWLKDDNPDLSVKQYKSYKNRAAELIGKNLYHELGRFARKTKHHYMTASRIISFLRKKLGLKQQAEELRELIGKRPKSGSDTYVPPLRDIVEAGKKLRKTRIFPVYLILVSNGSRLTEAIHALKEADWKKLVCLEDKGICRLHIDYERGNKNIWTLYMPSEIAHYIRNNIDKIREQLPSYDNIEKKLASAGIPAKYYRNFTYNYMRLQGIPRDIAEWIQGRIEGKGTGFKHYLEKIMQSDEYYPRYAQWLKENILQEIMPMLTIASVR